MLRTGLSGMENSQLCCGTVATCEASIVIDSCSLQSPEIPVQSIFRGIYAIDQLECVPTSLMIVYECKVMKLHNRGKEILDFVDLHDFPVDSSATIFLGFDHTTSR